MALDDLINAITGCPYGEMYKTLPDDVNKPQVVSVYEDIIRDCLSDHSPCRSPYLINVSGIPGSGKSTFCRKLSENPDCASALYIGFDAIMEHRLLPYRQEEAVDPEEAFRRWELPARIAGYELLKRAVAGKYPILFEHSGALPQHLPLFENLLQTGYKIHFYYLSIAVEDAKQRVHNRKRQVPLALIDQRNGILQELLPAYQKICTTYKRIEPCEPELS